ncbi:MAG: nucleotidyl transferase AbiEii/AbiGii toxin family protein [Candidatus Omnitrophica bacterium]|nr:nucleotidyl transferase AbiEii/AbiGii toxin family protein [Candidatus Omnitrophota bacterium]
MDASRPEILTPLQRTVLEAVFAEEALAPSFYLTGGTALAAYYLFHRYSDDLDLFTNDQSLEVVWPTLQRLLPVLGLTVESRTPQFIRLRHPEGLRVDVVRDVPFRVGVPVRQGTWLVDTLDNIALNKVAAIQGRLDVKDYVDLYLLLKDHPQRILTWLAQAKQKDASIEPFLWSRLIGDVETFRVLPRMIVPLQISELVTFYRNLRRLILASLKPSAA